MSTADRLLTILDLFTIERPDWSIEEASESLGIPTSTVYRYFNSLTQSGLAVTAGGGRYILGPSIIRLDRQLRLTDPLVRSARGEMDRLARAFAGKALVFMCRLFGDQVMCVSQASMGELPFTISYERGRLMPLFAGSASRVILANLPAGKIQALYRKYPDEFRARQLGDTLPEVRSTLKSVKDDGHFVTAGEVDAGMRGISVPILVSGKIIGSLTVAGPRPGLNPPQVARALDGLREASRHIAEELHHWSLHSSAAARI